MLHTPIGRAQIAALDARIRGDRPFLRPGGPACWIPRVDAVRRR